jgi:L-arabinonolactonase
MNAPRAECINATRSVLGECPVWDEKARVLYYVDIEAPALFRLDPETGIEQRWEMPARIGCFALGAGGSGAVVALATGFAHFDFAKGVLSPLANPLEGVRDHRLNDGAVDPAGRFWSGSMAPAGRSPSGKVYCLENGRARTVFEGFRVPNGFAWSQDGARFFINDSPRAMFVAEFDAATGHAGAPYVFADVSAAPGFPDGMAFDAEGFLWNARWDGKGLARFAPDGRLDRFVPMPVSRPTSCAFGGANLDQLYVTSAHIGFDDAKLAAEPLAGGVFALDVGVKGMPARRWRGR